MKFKKFYYDEKTREERLVFYKQKNGTGQTEIEYVESAKTGNLLALFLNYGIPAFEKFVGAFESVYISQKGNVLLNEFLIKEFTDSDNVSFEISGRKRSRLLQYSPSHTDIKIIHDMLEEGIGDLVGLHPIFEFLKDKNFNWFSWDFDSPLYMTEYILKSYFGENVSKSKTLNINLSVSIVQSLILFYGIIIRIGKVLEVCGNKIAFIYETSNKNIISLTTAQKHYIYSHYIESDLNTPSNLIVTGLPAVIGASAGDDLPEAQYMEEGENNVSFLKRIVSSVKNKNLKMAEVVDAADITGVINFCFAKVVTGSIVLKICENCGKYFTPESRSDEIYCQNIFKDGKTCKQKGYENKSKEDKITAIYRTAYKTQHAKMQRNRYVEGYREKVFDVWVSKAKEMRTKTRNGQISINEFENWISENK